MNIRFYIDPETALPHIYGHQVDEGEVEDVLKEPGEDRPGREDSRVAIGQTRAGRSALFMCLTQSPIPCSSLLPIS